MATKKRTSKRRGGFWGLGSIINTAVVPGSLLAMQQSFRKKKHGGTHKRRHTRKVGGIMRRGPVMNRNSGPSYFDSPKNRYMAMRNMQKKQGYL